MRHKTPFLVFIILFPLIGISQTDLSLLGTGGSMAVNNGVYLSYSFGEPFNQYQFNSETWLTEGFQQPESIDLTTGIGNHSQENPIQIMPVPAKEELILVWSQDPCIAYTIITISGTEISYHPIQSQDRHAIALDHLTPGIYWILLEFEKSQSITRSFIKL